MILHALHQYYHRKQTAQESSLAPFGFEWKELGYIVVLDLQGNPVLLESTYEWQGKNRRGKSFLVPQAESKTSGIKANFLWENLEYALEIPIKNDPERVQRQHAAFVARIDSISCEDEGLAAVKSFLALLDKRTILEKLDGWDGLIEAQPNITFRLVGESKLIAQRPQLKQSWLNQLEDNCAENAEICMVSGTRQPIARIHKSIKGVRGSKSSGASLVAFNLTSSGSFGKEQGENAPVGEGTAFAYTTALNHLLGPDSKQKIHVADTTLVFWAEKPHDLETAPFDIFGEPSGDDPDRLGQAINNVYKSVHSGTQSAEGEDTRFYLLGLSPNAARIAIRFWITDTVLGIASKIKEHLDDLNIILGARDAKILPFQRLLAAIAPEQKFDNIPPKLAGDTLRSIFEGTPYPRTLLQAALRRIRAEQKVTRPLASLVKACLNRGERSQNPTNPQELYVSLDKHNQNIGYRLGRLFAVLEKIQLEALPKINATIRDRFYGAASGTPVTVFSNLMRLKNHHLSKLESNGRRVYFEKLLGEIIGSISDFPSHLSLPNQGRFAIGYYHQTQDFYSKNSAPAQVLGAGSTGDLGHDET